MRTGDHPSSPLRRLPRASGSYFGLLPLVLMRNALFYFRFPRAGGAPSLFMPDAACLFLGQLSENFARRLTVVEADRAILEDLVRLVPLPRDQDDVVLLGGL